MSLAPTAQDPAQASPGNNLAALRVLLWAGAVVSFLMFGVAAWALYQQAMNESRLRVESAARVAEEHALKVFETNIALIGRVADLLDAAPQRAPSEAELHAQLVRMAEGLPQVQGIYVIGADARMQATNRVYPVSRAIDYSDRAWYRHHASGGSQPFFTELLLSRATGEPFFDVNMRRNLAGGAFGGTVSVSLRPAYFEDFYRDLAGQDRRLQILLLRADGAVLARWPEPAQLDDAPRGAAAAAVPPSAPGPATAQAAGSPDVRPAPQVVAAADGRIAAHRVLPRQPVHVVASMDRSDALGPWYRQLLLLAGLGLPTTIGLVHVTSIALQRTRRALQSARALQEQTLQRRRVEEALRQAQKLEALGRLSGGVAHDFNNLLMVIGNNVYLQRRLAPAVAESPQLAAIERAVASGTQLTRQLLSFSRRQALRPERVRLQDRMPVAMDMARPALGAGITLQVGVEPQTPAIEVDVSEFELALLNLAINARDAMPHGGRLDVQARAATPQEAEGRSGSFIVVAVSDSGVGIAEADLPRVFEPFFTTKEAGQGTGLGLSQVYGFCERAGGWARIDSAAGRGTTVRLVLPAAPQDTLPPATAQEVSAVSLQGTRVLLVEDNEEVAAGTQAVLHSMGCTVDHVPNAFRAMRHLQDGASRYDLMLSDIVMPGSMNGIELAVWAQRQVPQLPVLLMSGYTESSARAAELDLEVLPKPCPPEVLRAAMQVALLRAPAAKLP